MDLVNRNSKLESRNGLSQKLGKIFLHFIQFLAIFLMIFELVQLLSIVPIISNEWNFSDPKNQKSGFRLTEYFANFFAQIPGKQWSNKTFSKTIKFVAINNWNFVKLSFVMKLLTDQQFHHDIVPAIQFYVNKEQQVSHLR